MASTMIETLSAAVAQKSPVTLAPANHKAAEKIACTMKFIAATPEGIYLQSTAAQVDPLPRLLKDREPLLATFCSQDARHVFKTTLAARKLDFWLTESMAIEAWLIPTPAEVQQIDERRFPRYQLQDSGGIHGQVFESAYAPGMAALGSNVWDIGLGGASFVCPVSGKFLSAQNGVRLTTVLTTGAKKTILGCKLIHARKMTSKTMRLGVSFDPAGSEGQSTETTARLHAIITDLCNRRQKRIAG